MCLTTKLASSSLVWRVSASCLVLKMVINALKSTEYTAYAEQQCTAVGCIIQHKQSRHAGRIRLASSSSTSALLLASYAEGAKQCTQPAGYATSVKQ